MLEWDALSTKKYFNLTNIQRDIAQKLTVSFLFLSLRGRWKWMRGGINNSVVKIEKKVFVFWVVSAKSGNPA